MKELIKFLLGLVPDEQSTPEQHREWRKRVALTIIFLLIVVGLLVVAVGFIYDFFRPTVVDRFVRYQDVQAVSAQLSTQIGHLAEQVQTETSAVHTHEITQLRSQLLDVLTKDCKAKNEELRQIYGRQMDDMTAEYQRLTGTPYVWLPCSSL
jgi:hypothetical protein